MFIFAIFGYYLFGYPGGDEENWGNLGVALLTLFSFVTVRILAKYGDIERLGL